MEEYAIEVRDVYFAYDEQNYVLRGINLVIRAGERVAIMGENGAGKTTLIKHFNGLLKPQKGYVKIFGTDTRKASVSELARRVGIVFQNPDHQLFAETVEEEIAFALRNFGYPEDVIKRRVEWALRVMDLTKYRNVSPLMLSGGERKRVAIAAVLGYDPDIVVFDEPTTGQDYLQKQKIAQLLYMLSLQGKTVIVVSHDVEFVAENFERVVVMSGGRIICDGSTREVLSDENILEQARLLPPQITECALKLRKRGLPVDVKVLREDELAVQLNKYFIDRFMS